MKKPIKSVGPNLTSGGSAELVAESVKAKVAAQKSQTGLSKESRMRTNTETDSQESNFEAWLTFGNAFAGRETPNRALMICRTWIELEKRAHQIALKQIRYLDRFTKKNERTFWARSVSNLIAKLS